MKLDFIAFELNIWCVLLGGACLNQSCNPNSLIEFTNRRS